MTADKATGIFHDYLMENGLDGTSLGYFRFVRFKKALLIDYKGTPMSISKMVIASKEKGDVYIEDCPVGYYSPEHLDRIAEFLKRAEPYRRLSRQVYFASEPEQQADKAAFGALRLHRDTLERLQGWKRETEERTGAAMTWDAFFGKVFRNAGPLKLSEHPRLNGDVVPKTVILPQGVTEAMLAKSINDCGFSTRTRNALAANDISHVGVLCSCSEIMISYIRNLGKQGLREIRYYLDSNNLDFGMDLRDYGYEKPEWM